MPLSLLGNTLTIAISDPLNVFILDDLRNLTGKEIDIVIASESQILRAIDQFYLSAIEAMAEATQHLEGRTLKSCRTLLQRRMMRRFAEQAPVIRIVNLIIKEAIRQRASDIHIEPLEQGMRVRFRIDGMLQDILTIPKESKNAVGVRIKIMAGLDITNFQPPGRAFQNASRHTGNRFSCVFTADDFRPKNSHAGTG